jgi:hypothetical protein
LEDLEKIEDIAIGGLSPRNVTGFYDGVDDELARTRHAIRSKQEKYLQNWKEV